MCSNSIDDILVHFEEGTIWEARKVSVLHHGDWMYVLVTSEEDGTPRCVARVHQSKLEYNNETLASLLEDEE